MTFTIDVTGAAQLTADLIVAGRTVEKEAPKVVSKGALNIKKQMQAELKESPHFKRAAYAVTYDLNGTEAEIGPEFGHEKGDKKAAGSLAFIAAFGTADTPAWWDFTKALRDETPNFEKYLADMAADAL